jgi:DNA transformation protein
MGEKGAKASQAGADAAARLLDDLQSIGDVASKKMFGGHGIFRDGVMFAMVDADGNEYLRADASTAPDFEAAGSPKHGRMPYWAIPLEVRRIEEDLVVWATRAAAVADAAR